MHGIILCGGSGSRLKPFTNYFSKSLYPIADKFVIDFPIETLKSLGITDLIVVLGDKHFSQIVAHLKDGATIGMKISYIYQETADGIASAIYLAKDILKNNPFIVILGDNLINGKISLKAFGEKECGIFLYDHPEKDRFGVATIDKDGISKIQEKPKLENLPNSVAHYAIMGLYKFGPRFFEYFPVLSKSARNEYEICDIISKYWEDDNIGFSIFDGFWIDCGTHAAVNEVRKQIENGVISIG